MALKVGSTMDGYRVERKLGAGGFGTTYLARHHQTDQKVAIKEIRDAGRDDAIREAKHLVLADEHPNLAKLLFVIDNTFLVMNYVDGPTLADVHRERGSFNPVDWWHSFRGLLEAVAHLHSCEVVHRDIKPDNIIVNRRRCVLVDLGAARPVGGLTMPIGTDEYSPPEFQRGADQHGPEYPWDIYSLAVVSYEVLNEPGPMPDQDEMIAWLKSSHTGYVRAIAEGLQRNPLDRPQNIVNWICQMVTPTDEAPNEKSSWYETSRTTTGSSWMDTDIDDLACEGDAHDSESWDERTLADLRDQIVEVFDLPRRSIGFRYTWNEDAGFGSRVNNFVHSWTDHDYPGPQRGGLPRNRYEARTVAHLKRKVADVYRLPEESVVVRKPDGSRYRRDAQVSTVRRDHGD